MSTTFLADGKPHLDDRPASPAFAFKAESGRAERRDAGAFRDETETWDETMNDPYRLERFVVAQNQGGTYDRARQELRAGRKESHWMWFVFPQIAGLGFSAMSIEYAISSLEEAQAYLRHALLGPRLRECAVIVLQTQGLDAQDIFGDIDAQKLHSSMTLFVRAAPDEPLFTQMIDRFFGGRPDRATDERL